MDRHPFTEDREDQLAQFLDAQIKRIKTDILTGVTATVITVASQIDGFNCDEDEAEALVRAAVLGHSALVGDRIAGLVELAIFEVAQPLAEQDLLDHELRLHDNWVDQQIDLMKHPEAA